MLSCPINLCRGLCKFVKSAFCACFPLYPKLRATFPFTRASFLFFLRSLYFNSLPSPLLPRAKASLSLRGSVYFLFGSYSLPLTAFLPCAFASTRRSCFRLLAPMRFSPVILLLCAYENAPLLLTVCAYAFVRSYLRPSAVT